MMSNNNIEYIYKTETIKHGSLTNLHRLVHLDLSSNRLKSAQEGSFKNLYSLTSVELDNNPWQCDCFLSYLKTWLTETRSVLGSESNIRCSAPEVFTDVTINSIDLEALICNARIDVQSFANVDEVSSNELSFTWASMTPDPSFVKRNVMYGPLKCQDCSDDTFQQALSTIDNCKIVEMDSSAAGNTSMRISGLLPDTRYGICVYDSLQRPEQVEASQCISVWTSAAEVIPIRAVKSSSAAASPPAWFWTLLCVIILLISVSFVMAFIWRKRSILFQDSKDTPGSSLYDPRNTSRDDYYIPGYQRSATVPAGSYPFNKAYGYTSRTTASDRTYAECGSCRSDENRGNNTSLDATREFDVIVNKSNCRDFNRRLLSLPHPDSPSRLVSYLLSIIDFNLLVSNLTTHRCFVVRERLLGSVYLGV